MLLFQYLDEILGKWTFMKPKDNIQQSHQNEKSLNGVSEYDENYMS